MDSSPPLPGSLEFSVRFALSDSTLFSDLLKCGFFIHRIFQHDFSDALGDADQLRRRRGCSLLSLRDQHCDLAFDLAPRFELFKNFSYAAAQKFFMQLGDFARDYDVPVASEKLDYVGQSFEQSMWGFVENLRAGRIFHAFQQLAALA